MSFHFPQRTPLASSMGVRHAWYQSSAHNPQKRRSRSCNADEDSRRIRTTWSPSDNTTRERIPKALQAKSHNKHEPSMIKARTLCLRSSHQDEWLSNAQSHPSMRSCGNTRGDAATRVTPQHQVKKRNDQMRSKWRNLPKSEAQED